MKPILMKAIKQYFQVVPFIMLHKVVLTCLCRENWLSVGPFNLKPLSSLSSTFMSAVSKVVLDILQSTLNCVKIPLFRSVDICFRPHIKEVPPRHERLLPNTTNACLRQDTGISEGEGYVETVHTLLINKQQPIESSTRISSPRGEDKIGPAHISEGCKVFV